MRKTTTKMTDILALAVFAVFSLCILAVLLTGVRVYKNLVQSGGEAYDCRTCAQYVSTRVRQGADPAVEAFSGCQALTFREEAGGAVYLTRVYCWEGYLRELYCAEGADLSPEDGEKILPAQQLTASVTGRTLTVTVDGQTLVFFLRGGEEAGS